MLVVSNVVECLDLAQVGHGGHKVPIVSVYLSRGYLLRQVAAHQSMKESTPSNPQVVFNEPSRWAYVLNSFLLKMTKHVPYPIPYFPAYQGILSIGFQEVYIPCKNPGLDDIVVSNPHEILALRLLQRKFEIA